MNDTTHRVATQRAPSDEELHDLLTKARTETPYLLELGGMIFEAIVNPQIHYEDSPSALMVAQVNMAFSEWLLFDFSLDGSDTLMTHAAKADPTLREFVNTQFYSRFWVVSQDRHAGTSLLRDVQTCEDYLLSCGFIAANRRWASGTLGVRIARVNGVWRLAGQVHLHDNAPMPLLPGEGEAQEAPEADPMDFISNVEAVMGHLGAFRTSLMESSFIDPEDYGDDEPDDAA